MVTTAAGLALMLSAPSGTDLAAQQARAAFAAAHPGAAVDFGWFGGVLPAAYSVLVPYVEAVLGARLTGVLAAIAAGPLLGVLLVRWGARRPAWAAAWGGLALVADMASGRTTFAVGLAVGLAALVAVPEPAQSVAGPPARARGRWALAVGLAVLTTLCSPVAALFLGLVAVGWALARPRVAVLALAAAAPLAVIAMLFPEPGRMPFTWAVARPVLIACLAVAVVCRSRPVRVGALLYALGVLVVYLMPGPIGSNAERLALLFTGCVLLADGRRLPSLVMVAAVLVAGQWTARVPLTDLRHSSRLATEHAASQRLVGILDRLGPIRGRVEVVPFADHGESAVVPAAWPLARGWERQVDVLRARPLYRHDLTASSYFSWLSANNVEYVALGRHAHDWSAAGELRVLRAPPPWLEVVHQDAEWTVWRVVGSTPLVSGDAEVVAVTQDRIVVDAPRPGHLTVGLRWSRWLTVRGADACIAAASGKVDVVVRKAGRLTLSSSYLAPLSGHHC